MNVWKKFLALLIAVMLLLSVIPVAFAAEIGETESTAESESTPAETTPSAETSAPAETAAPTETPSWRVDYSDLEFQIALANGLNGYEYTIETWTALQKVVEKGSLVLKWRYAQKGVDAAAQAIEDAVAALVKVDYSRLEAALGEVRDLIEKNPDLHDVWGRLDAAVAEAKPLLVSGNQTAVNEAAAEINALLEEWAECADVQQPADVVIQEVEVEVLPTDDYCNIPMHRTWPVLFVISAVLNVALVVVLTYVLVKKRNTTDDTPLVSYDIDDDMDF